MADGRGYEKLRLLGAGTFGQAWLCRAAASAREQGTCVVKEVNAATLNEKQRQQALTEVTALSRCNHDNVIRYIDAYVTGTLLNIVMEYADQGDLHDQIVAREGLYFPQEVVFDWLIQISLALRHIHGLNILHRDLKAKNIFLSRGGIVKLGDFGISRVLTDSVQNADTVVGTPYYLSPEICQHQPYNQKSDMWALGCVLYELFCLTHPFQGTNFAALVLAILKASYNPLPRQYGWLPRMVVSSLLCVEPQNRLTADHLLGLPALQPYLVTYAKRSQELHRAGPPAALAGQTSSAPGTRNGDDAFRVPTDHVRRSRFKPTSEMLEPEKKQLRTGPLDGSTRPDYRSSDSGRVLDGSNLSRVGRDKRQRKGLDCVSRVREGQRRKSTPRPIQPSVRSGDGTEAPVCNVLLTIVDESARKTPESCTDAHNVDPTADKFSSVESDAELPHEVRPVSSPQVDVVASPNRARADDSREGTSSPGPDAEHERHRPTSTTDSGHTTKRRTALIERDRNVKSTSSVKDAQKTPSSIKSAGKFSPSSKDVYWSEGKENARVKNPVGDIDIRYASLSSPKMEAIIQHHKRQIHSAESIVTAKRKSRAKTKSPKLALFREMLQRQQTKSALPSNRRSSQLRHQRLKNNGRTYNIYKEIKVQQHSPSPEADDVSTMCCDSPTKGVTSPHHAIDVFSPQEGARIKTDEPLHENQDQFMRKSLYETLYMNLDDLDGKRKYLQTLLEDSLGSSEVKKTREFVEYCLQNGISYESMESALDTKVIHRLPYIFQLIQLDNIQNTVISSK